MSARNCNRCPSQTGPHLDSAQMLADKYKVFSHGLTPTVEDGEPRDKILQNTPPARPVCLFLYAFALIFADDVQVWAAAAGDDGLLLQLLLPLCFNWLPLVIQKGHILQQGSLAFFPACIWVENMWPYRKVHCSASFPSSNYIYFPPTERYSRDSRLSFFFS